MTDVNTAAAELARCLDAAQALISEPDMIVTTHVTGSASSSEPPWNSAAADVWFTAAQGIRVLETQVRGRIGESSAVVRGGSDGNTYAAIDALTDLVHALPEHVGQRVAAKFEMWAQAAKQLPAIDEVARWVPLRANSKTARLQPLCEYCGQLSLRVAERSIIIACFFKACRDGDGKQPLGRVGLHRVTKKPVIEWNDGHVQYPDDAG